MTIKTDTHPCPQFKRTNYTSLNGVWRFESVGEKKLSAEIVVPFCPESALSGIGETDFLTDCVYSRTIEIAPEDLNGRLALHFGAVDYIAEVFVNGHFVCRHQGGYTPFEADIAPFAHAGQNRLEVRVHDDARENTASGKQSAKQQSYGCFYTRTTGIWQSVWLERTPRNYLRSVRFFPDVSRCAVDVELVAEGGGTAQIAVFYDGREVGRAAGEVGYRRTFRIALEEAHLWEVGNGRLYTVSIALDDDRVESYFGLREVRFDGRRFLLNGKSVFQRLVLDQGYYPDGVYTPADDEAMIRDIRLGLELGFNGARLHQKLFDPRYLYHCDRMGYMVWGEYPSWGVETENADALGQFIAEWIEAVARDCNHPSIVTWCPINEAWENLDDNRRVRDPRFVESVYHVTKTLDPTRPCVDTSGGYHGRYTDIFDVHCYYEPERFVEQIEAIAKRDELTMEKTYAPDFAEENIIYDKKQPIHVSEYGGVAYGHAGKGWGYKTAESEEAFVEKYIETTQAILACDKICGMCYTQLYDVEQEQNGLYTFDRKAKLREAAIKRIRDCNCTVAAIEKREASV